jgi:subtilase family serine protease
MSKKLLARVAASILGTLGLLSATPYQIASGGVQGNVPAAVAQAVDLGPVNPAQELNLTVNLKLPNRTAFDTAVDELYNPASPTYEHWMTDADLSKFAPTAAQIQIVTQELQKHGLAVLSTDPVGFSIRVHGTVANAEAAFQTQLHQLSLNNTSFRANTQQARLTGAAGAYVASVAGLGGGTVHPMTKHAVDPRTGFTKTAPVPLSKIAATGGLASIITDNCFTTPKTFTFVTPGTSLPVGVYFGNDYDDTTKTCSFTPAQLQFHYGLIQAYSNGFDGTGTTIVLVEAYGYPTMLSDANAFSQLTGLPKLNSSNFQVIYPEGKPSDPNAGVLTGWDVEIALDIQWSHSIAPKAKIVVLAAAGQDNEDFQDAINYAITHKLGYSISNSWGVDLDDIAGPLELDSYNTLLEKAAAKGISVNFSSGDSGDNGLGTPLGAPSVPSDAPYATAVGGTSILYNINGSPIETGWGNNITFLNISGPLDPPVQNGFVGGAGGGESVYFKKPKWQSALPGTGRQVPDISALADPYTGVPIVLTSGGVQAVEAGWGGTSLACPIFSAIWAIANQVAGHPLGQAAPKIASLSANQVYDIVPHSSPTNVTGTIYDASGPTFYSAADLLSADLFTTQFVSAIWPVFSTEDLDISFGTDSSLTVATGWDNVTGFGVPNGFKFIMGAAGK